MKNRYVLMFDLGGVIENHDLNGLAKLLAKKCGADYNEFYDFMMKNLRLNDKCKITDLELIKRLNKKFGLKLTIDSYYKEYHKFIKPNWNMLQFIRRIKKECKVVIFSNTRRLHLKGSLKKVNYKKIFDHMFISQNFCTRKPELKYYKSVLSLMGVKAEDCIFIDDKERNLLPARKLGIHCVQYKNMTDMKSKLNGFGLI